MVAQQKCLIIRKHGNIGDILMMLPALHELAKSQQLEVSLPKQYFEVLQNLNFINKTLECGSENTNAYDVVYDLSDFEYNYEHLNQPQVLLSKQDLFAQAVHVRINKKNPIISLTQAESAWADEFLRIQNPRKHKVAILAIKSTSPKRDWSIEKWKSLAKKLDALGFLPIIVDKSLSWDDPPTVFFNDKTLRQLFAITSKTDIVITLDSGMLHIAAAFDKTTLGIFGPTDPKVRCIYPNSHFVRKNLSCSPCWYNRCKSTECLASLKVEDVEKKLEEVLYLACI